MTPAPPTVPQSVAKAVDEYGSAMRVAKVRRAVPRCVEARAILLAVIAEAIERARRAGYAEAKEFDRDDYR